MRTVQEQSTAQLAAFEALNHGFWYEANLPESKEADEVIARFFDAHLGKAASLRSTLQPLFCAVRGTL
jgi:hypothetical protein